MRDEMKSAGTSTLADGKVILPQLVLDEMRIHPDDYVEIFNYSGVGQIEFSGISYVDDDLGIFIPDEILMKLDGRDRCEFTLGKDGDMAILRVEANEKRDDVSTRQRHLTKGTLTSKLPPVEMRLYKHVCDVIRYGSSSDYVPLGDSCALCGNALKGKKQFPYAPAQPHKCVRCGQQVRSNYCGNCGLKLVRKESVRRCRNCGEKLEYIQKYGRFYCYKCGRYDRALKPGVKDATCPDCGKELSYVKKHDHWYCYECKGYRVPLESVPADRRKTCPECKGNLTYMEQHDKYYCRKCAGYKDVGEKKTAETPEAAERAPDKPRPPEQKPDGQKQDGTKPAAQKPTAQKPAAQKPAGQKPAPQKQPEQKPAPKKPDMKKPVDLKPQPKPEIKKQPPKKPPVEEIPEDEKEAEDAEVAVPEDATTDDAPPPEDEETDAKKGGAEEETTEQEEAEETANDGDEAEPEDKDSRSGSDKDGEG